jgi:hypothetical protein
MTVELGQRYRSKSPEFKSITRVISKLDSISTFSSEKLPLPFVYYELYVDGVLKGISGMTQSYFLECSELIPLTSTSSERLLSSMKGEARG